MDYEVREANTSDGNAMLALMPRLADFTVPPWRNAEDLYRDDARLLQSWLDGDVQCLVNVAVTEENTVLGFTLVRLRPEALSQQPSAHLEAIAVARSAEGQGVAKSLLEGAERNAKAHGALTMTLHVISTNDRARDFYEHSGYDADMLRYTRDLR